MKIERLSTYIYVILSCLTTLACGVAVFGAADMDYAITKVTFFDAISIAVKTPLKAVLQNNLTRSYIWFSGSAFVSIMILFIHKIFIRVVLLTVGLLLACLAASPYSVILGIIFPLYFISTHDGETWGETWPAGSAVGFWIIITIFYISLELYKAHIAKRKNQYKNKTSAILSS